MFNSRSNPRMLSASRSINDIIEQYSSPALRSSSLEQGQKPCGSFSYDEQRTDRSTPTSPPLHTPSASKPLGPYQANSTHSGYLDRAQLFGRMPLASSLLIPMEVLGESSSTRSRSGTQAGVPNTPDQQIPRHTAPTPSLCLHKRLSSAADDDWITAGTLESNMEDSGVSLDVASGLICSSSTVTTPSIERDIPHRRPFPAKPRARKISPAETALREHFKKSRVTPNNGHGRNSSWAKRIFSNRDLSNAISTLKPSVTSEDDESEFGYVDPKTPAESPRDILARVKAREARVIDDEYANQLLVQEQHVEHTANLDDSSTDVQRPSRGASSFSCSSSISHMALAGNESPLREHRSPVGGGTEIPLSSIVVAIDVAPLPSRQEVTTISTQGPALPTTTQLFMNAIITPILQPPFAPCQPLGLTFAEANAIIYACTMFAAMRYALFSLRSDIAAMDLVLDLCVGFIVAVVICTFLHWVKGGGLRCVLGDVLRGVGAVLGELYASFLEEFARGWEQKR